jgi:L-asparagine transporter-like permease
MIEFIKKVWAGPFSVKVSLVFLLCVVLIMLLGNPGMMIFTIALVYSVFSIAEWLAKEDE